MGNKGIRNKLISVYINEGDEWRNRPLHIQILKMLQSEGLSGGTVLRAVAGFSGGENIQITSLIDVGGNFR